MNNLTDSILTSVKIMLGIPESMTAFDAQIIMHINSVIMTLNQLNVGVEGFTISDDTATWKDFIGTAKNLEAVKSYIYIKIRLLFDPPQQASVQQSFEANAKEIEWRLNANADVWD